MNQGRIVGAIYALGVFLSVSASAVNFEARPGEYVVRLKPSDSAIHIQSIQQALGAQVKEVVSQDLNIILVTRPIIENSESAIQSLAENSTVLYAEPNYIYRASVGSTVTPNDPEFYRLWGLSNTGQKPVSESGTFTGTPGIDIDAVRAWQVETGSKNVVVAVIDTGVNYREQDLVNNIYVNKAELNGVAGVDDDGNGFVDDVHGWNFVGKNNDPMDVFGHGTHCSGTIGASANDGYGITGVAWNVSILPVRFLGDDGGGTLADAIAAIDYATKMKVNIMSASWGGGGFSQALMDSIARARDANILFVAAAGNDSQNMDKTLSYPAGFALDNIIGVAAIDPNGKIASFSNYGLKTVHIAAPGVGIVSHTMKGLESWDGTSMATPHVSGVAALLLSQDMTQSYSVLKNRILNSARPLAGLRNRVITGGMLNAYYALTNQKAPADLDDPVSWTVYQQTAATAHPYAASTKQEWTLTVPGAKRIAVSFSRFETEDNYDRVQFKDATGKVVATSMSGALGKTAGPVITGDTVTVSFASDSSQNEYGFDIDGVFYQ